MITKNSNQLQLKKFRNLSTYETNDPNKSVHALNRKNETLSNFDQKQ